jgi:TolB protein
MDNPLAKRVTLSWQVMTVFLAANLLILAALGYLAFPGRPLLFGLVTPSASQTATSSQTPSPSLTSSLTLSATTTDTPLPTLTPLIATAVGPLSQGVMLLSIKEGGYAHLFAYSPGALPLTRLTNQPWDDITPAFSPDGSKVAYSSRQNGYWDLYLLDLASGQTTRLTDNAAYDAHPTWSPDGQWLAYESYTDNFDIYILSVADPSQAPIQLTANAGSNTAPDWSGGSGRKVAFVSTRTGEADIWVADLDIVDNRFTDASQSPQTNDAHPVWSPDGSRLAWAANANGVTSLYMLDLGQPGTPPRLAGGGSWPVFSPDGQVLASFLEMPNQYYITAYLSGTTQTVLAPERLPGPPQGLDWSPASLPQPLPASLAQARDITPTPLWAAQITPITAVPPGRQNVIALNDVSAPNAYLLDDLDEAFYALRSHVSAEIGWDFLASLDNAFIPLTSPLEPGDFENWLYTGRSFATNNVPMNAGWLVVGREDFGGQTYWRLYLKTRYQDGSQGAPIEEPTWDLEARYSGNPQIYEQGGIPAALVPAGYWYDFTDLAISYGWERLPALVNWRTYFPGIRFNQFVYREGLDWKSAMLSLYPVEILITPTAVLPPTATATKTPQWMRPRTATPTASATATSTRRPTWTPVSP